MAKELSKNKNLPAINSGKQIEQLYQKISGHIDKARQSIQRSIDTEMVRAYWLIDQDIVNYEQQGEARAGYGKSILKNLSEKLVARYQRKNARRY